jgi:uncharacterized membrane protein
MSPLIKKPETRLGDLHIPSTPSNIPSDVIKTLIDNEWKIVIVKLIYATIALLAGVFLLWNGCTTSDYSIKIQTGVSAYIEAKNTAPGILLILLSLIIVWRTKQKITFK